MSQIFGKYTVDSVDSKAAAAKASIEFSDGEAENFVRIHAKVANVMNGRLKKEGNKLSGHLTSTMMMGSEAQMAIENTLGQALSEGVTVTMAAGSKITLQSSSHTIVLVPQ